MLTRFNILIEDIRKTLVVDTFDFEFIEDDDKVLCKFNIFDKNSNTAKKVTADLDKMEFTIDNDVLSEKEFMLSYYTDYKNVKKAFENYQQEKKELNTSVEIENSPVVPFNKKVDMNENLTITIDNFQFIVSDISDKNFTGLTKINFVLNNPDNLPSELTTYNCICLTKKSGKNTIPIKFIMINPDDEQQQEEWIPQKFKTRFPQMYKIILKVIDQI